MLDGGAMFGVVPKSIWQKTNPADSNNMIQMAARCLLVEDGGRLVLIMMWFSVLKTLVFKLSFPEQRSDRGSTASR